MEGTWSLQGHDRPPATPPTCGHCGHRLRLVDSARPRHLTTPFGPKTRLPRPYYVCPDGHHGWAAGDEAWHLGPGHLSPAMTQIVAEAGARLAFGEAARLLGRTLGVTIDDNDVERTTENMGMLVDAQAALRAEAPAPEQPPDPGSDVLLLCVDGGRVHAGGEWREAKCAAVAALGPKTVVDDRTGRSRLVVGDKHYAATIASSDDFFSQRVRPLAEDFGLHHPRVHTVALLADGGPWIEKRWGTLGIPPTIAVVDILDIRHLEEHLHACADAVFGEHTPRAEAWAKDLSAAVRRQGPAPLRQALQKLHPQTKKAKARARRFGRYVEANAHRLDYPSYRAQGLPIGSGLVEAEVKTVVNQRAKRSGMRWSVPGAQALLAFVPWSSLPRPAWNAFGPPILRSIGSPSPCSQDQEGPPDATKTGCTHSYVSRNSVIMGSGTRSRRWECSGGNKGARHTVPPFARDDAGGQRRLVARSQ